MSAQVVADSKNQYGDRITTYLLTFPRFILAVYERIKLCISTKQQIY